MKVLAVETSGYKGSIALAEDRDLIEETFLSSEGRRHAQTLVLSVDDLLKAHSLTPQDIDCVAVSIGPGSFTGLRVGVVFAKTFAWANNSQVVAVDTLRAIAQQLDDSPKIVNVISDAQREEVFVNSYHWDAQTNLRASAESVRIERVETISGQPRQENAIWTGPALTKFATAFQSHDVASECCWNARAATVAHVGSQMLSENEVADTFSLEPLYIRRSYAEEKSANS